MIVFRFRKINRDHRFEVDIERYADETDACILFIKNRTDIVQEMTLDCDRLMRMSRNYNTSFVGNVRGEFDCLFPSGFREIARVIGITNSLAHYFAFSGSVKFIEESLFKFFCQCMGFAFIDWNVVAEEKDNQLLYLTTDDENKEGAEYLETLYEAGDAYKIDYEMGNNKGFTYCLDSLTLDKERNEFMRKLRIKINENLQKRLLG